MILGAVVASTGCMPAIRTLSAFSSRFPDNNREHVQAVYSRLPATAPTDRPENALGVPLVAAVRQGAEPAVVLFDLAAGRQLWSADIAATSAPEVLGDVVVVGTANAVVGLDIRTGQRLWSLDTRNMPYMGAARDGDTVVVVLSMGNSGAGARAGHITAVDARGGTERWSHQVVGILGRPAASSSFAFVPWDRQSIAVLDLATGVERARLRATDDVLSWVFAAPQGVYYGSRGAYRWTPSSASGTRTQSAYLGNPLEGVPGDPPLYRDAFVASTGTRTARDRIRFAFLPRAGEGDTMAVAHDTVYLAYYRFLVAIDVRSGDTRWARMLGPEEGALAPAEGVTGAEAARRAQASFSQYDIDSVTVTSNAVVVIGGDGTVRALDPNTGAVLGTQSLGLPVGAITTDLAGYRATGQGAAPAPEGTPREQLLALIRDSDNRLVPIRAYLVRLLARREEPEVTRDLLELYRQRSIPGQLREEIATALRNRRNGAQYLVHALEGSASHYNFLENRQAPPLDVIAPTLAAMEAREAVPVLLQHLLDHETPMASLPALISAIADLGDATVIPQLQAFVQRYRSDSAFAGERNAPLQTAVAAIFRLGDAPARQWLTSLSEDARAHQPLRQSITRLFEEERSGGERQSREEQLAQAREALTGRINVLRAAVGAYPARLSNEAFEDEWNNHLDELRECAQGVLTRRPDLNEIRITVTVRSEPASGMFQTTPPTPRLPSRPTFEQQMESIEEQTQWVEQQLNRLQSHQSGVRTIAYSPQDAEMQRCMDEKVRPLRFAGFGRSNSQQTFLQRISTVRAQARATNTPGFGTPEGSSLVVPWFLVSSPSLDRATGQLLAPAAPAAPTTGPATGTTPATSGATTSPSATPPAPTPPTLPGQTTPSSGGTRPWWEE
jgi:outer membrane protein assembly factor BamB